MLFFGLGVLFESLLLIANGLAILNEDRFLNKIGWGYHADMQGVSVKDRIISLLHAVRLLLRIPLILLNSVAIILLIAFG